MDPSVAEPIDARPFRSPGAVGPGRVRWVLLPDLCHPVFSGLHLRRVNRSNGLFESLLFDQPVERADDFFARESRVVAGWLAETANPAGRRASVVLEPFAVSGRGRLH